MDRDLPLYGIFVLLVLKQTLDWVGKLRDGSGRADVSEETGRLLRELHRWHAPNEEGTQTWKMRSTLLEELARGQAAVLHRLEVLERLVRDQDEA